MTGKPFRRWWHSPEGVAFTWFLRIFWGPK